jgi:hypothetical protein
VTEYDPTCPATGWRPDPALGARDWRPPDCTCTGAAYHPLHHAVVIHGETYVCPDEEIESLVRQVRLRQRETDA